MLPGKFNPFGLALWDYHRGDTTATLVVHSGHSLRIPAKVNTQIAPW
jgi:hypothetical protein